MEPFGTLPGERTVWISFPEIHRTVTLLMTDDEVGSVGLARDDRALQCDLRDALGIAYDAPLSAIPAAAFPIYERYLQEVHSLDDLLFAHARHSGDPSAPETWTPLQTLVHGVHASTVEELRRSVTPPAPPPDPQPLEYENWRSFDYTAIERPCHVEIH